MSEIVTIVESLVTIACYKCQIRFAVMEGFYKHRRDDHGEFYCPVGHPQAFTGKNATERERDSLRLQIQSANQATERAQTARDMAERRRAAAKGQLTKTRNRIAAGVCPCCNRTFQNLADHMRTQHVGYAASEPEEEETA